MQTEPQRNPNAIQPIHTFADDVEFARTHQQDAEVANRVTPVTVEVKRPRQRQPHEPIIQLANRGAKDYLNADDIAASAHSTSPLSPTPHAPTPVTPSKQPTPLNTGAHVDSELAKEIAIVAEQPKKQSILSDTGVIHDASEGADLPTGTIIKDKKRQRSGLLSTLGASVRSWFTTTEAEPEEQPEPTVTATPTVKESPVKNVTLDVPARVSETPEITVVPPSIPKAPAIAKKVEVITTPPKDDFNTVVETRQRKITPVSESALPIIKPAAETTSSDKSWTHYTEKDHVTESTVPKVSDTLPPLTPTSPEKKEVLASAARVAVAPAITSDRSPRPPVQQPPVVSTPPQPTGADKLPTPPQTPIKEPTLPVTEPVVPTPEAPVAEPVAPTPPAVPTPLSAPVRPTPVPLELKELVLPSEPTTPPRPDANEEDIEKISRLAVAQTAPVTPPQAQTPVPSVPVSEPVKPATPTPEAPVAEPVAPTPPPVPTPAPTPVQPRVEEPEPIIPIGEYAVTEQPYEAEEETTFAVARPKVRADGIRLIPLELKSQKPVSRENQLALVLTIVIVAIGLGIIATIQLFGTNTEPNYTVTRPLPPAVLAVDAKIPVALTTDRNDLLRDLNEVIEREQRLVQIYPTALSPRDREEPASATTILGTFAPRISGPFARTITDIAFGGSETAQPFIILRVMEFDTAFAGMIEWEKVMSADLVPLFGEAVTQSYNTQARAADGLLPATFVDTIIGNRSSRILFDASGAERITYTFVNQNTILITTNRTALEQLLPLVR